MEEIDIAPATAGRNAGRGDNFGWNRLEGTQEFRGNPPANAVPPVYEQSHDDGACSVTGGYVYRGTAIPALAGSYVFTDYCDGTLRTLTSSGNDEYDAGELGLEVENVSSFGQDNNGELFVLSQSRGRSTSSSPADPGQPVRRTMRPATLRVTPAGDTLVTALSTLFTAPGMESARPRSRSRSATATT